MFGETLRDTQVDPAAAAGNEGYLISKKMIPEYSAMLPPGPMIRESIRSAEDSLQFPPTLRYLPWQKPFPHGRGSVTP